MYCIPFSSEPKARGVRGEKTCNIFKPLDKYKESKVEMRTEDFVPLACSVGRQLDSYL